MYPRRKCRHRRCALLRRNLRRRRHRPRLPRLPTAVSSSSSSSNNVKNLSTHPRPSCSRPCPHRLKCPRRHWVRAHHSPGRTVSSSRRPPSSRGCLRRLRPQAGLHRRLRHRRRLSSRHRGPVPAPAPVARWKGRGRRWWQQRRLVPGLVRSRRRSCCPTRSRRKAPALPCRGTSTAAVAAGAARAGASVAGEYWCAPRRKRRPLLPGRRRCSKIYCCSTWQRRVKRASAPLPPPARRPPRGKASASANEQLAGRSARARAAYTARRPCLRRWPCAPYRPEQLLPQAPQQQQPLWATTRPRSTPAPSAAA